MSVSDQFWHMIDAQLIDALHSQHRADMEHCTRYAARLEEQFREIERLREQNMRLTRLLNEAQRNASPLSARRSTIPPPTTTQSGRNVRFTWKQLES